MAKGIVTDEFDTELAVEHNVGRLEDVRFPERGKRNGSVRIVVPGLQHPQLPSFDSRDRGLVENLEILNGKLSAAKAEAMKKAVAEGKSEPEPVELWVAYRSHVVRDQKVDNAVPWAEVPADAEHRHKRLIAIAEDRTDAAAEILSQAEFEVRAGRLGARRAAQADEVPNRPAGSEPMRSGGGQADTYGFLASVGTVEWAFGIYQSAGVPFGARHVHSLAEKLLAISDDLQGFLTDRPVNRNANSHTRARGVLRTVIERHPVPVASEDEGEWSTWEQHVRKTGQNLLDIAKRIHREHLAAQRQPPAQPTEQPPTDTQPAAQGAA